MEQGTQGMKDIYGILKLVAARDLDDLPIPQRTIYVSDQEKHQDNKKSTIIGFLAAITKLFNQT